MSFHYVANSLWLLCCHSPLSCLTSSDFFFSYVFSLFSLCALFFILMLSIFPLHIIWGNSPYSVHMIRLQEKIIRTITSPKNRDLYRSLFKTPNIFTFISPYIFLLLSFVITNREQYTGCHRRKGPNFRRVFLMLNYTDITQNTYNQS